LSDGSLQPLHDVLNMKYIFLKHK